MLGFAMRAGKLVLGCDLICRAMAKGGVKLVLIARDASGATKKRMTTKSEFYGISAIEADIDAERLGKLLGKTYPATAVAVMDNGFAEEIKKASVSI
jgi:ribosomal protein L7Ae-like RNA K-turn-binding protein